MKNNDIYILNLIAQIIFDKKGFNILALDISRFSSLTDYVLIAEGMVHHHVKALTKAIEDQVKEIGRRPLRIEGLEEGDWVVLDYFTILIHLFVSNIREKYQLEQLWKAGKIIDLHIDTHP